jgi:peptidoglycan/xylan/chitin deacetylase (PgdA/CDA1 family)
MTHISFSWDDGAKEDLKLMDLSLKCHIPGIFFIPATNPERGVIDGESIKLLAGNGFEIGAHTYSHVYLNKLGINEADKEMEDGKNYLEQLLGMEIDHFCFPGGKYNKNLIKISKKYFRTARTADTGAIVQNNSFLIKPAFHFYNRGKKSLIYNSLKNNSPIFRMSLINIACSDYFEFLRKLVDNLASNSADTNIIIWGHSWEIEQFQLWNKLEEMFRFISVHYPESIRSYSELLKSGNS